MPLFSIIIPVYKVEKYINKCLDSVLQQTYDNFECIIIDDGSPDNCGIICDEYAKKDKRIYVIHQENGGLSSARNVGIERSVGDYLLFLDSDDWIEEDTLEVLYKEISKSKPDIIVFGYAEVYGESKKNCTVEGVYADEAIKEKFISDEWRNFAWNKCFVSKLFYNVRFPINQVYEDLFTVPKLINSANKIYIISNVLYNYNQDNVSSITKNVNSRKEYDFFVALLSNYEIAKDSKYSCINICMYKCIEKVEETILLNYRDNLLTKEQIKFLKLFYEEFWKNNQSIIDLISDNKSYKLYHKAAMIEFNEKKFYLAMVYLFKYIRKKLCMV